MKSKFDKTVKKLVKENTADPDADAVMRLVDLELKYTKDEPHIAQAIQTHGLDAVRQAMGSIIENAIENAFDTMRYEPDYLEDFID